MNIQSIPTITLDGLVGPITDAQNQMLGQFSKELVHQMTQLESLPVDPMHHLIVGLAKTLLAVVDDGASAWLAALDEREAKLAAREAKLQAYVKIAKDFLREVTTLT